MKLRWKILIAAILFLILLAASLVVRMNLQPRNKVEAYKKLLRAQGEKLDLSELASTPVAPEDNAANAVEEAFKLIPTTEIYPPDVMVMLAPGKALVGWRQTDARCKYLYTNSWDEFDFKLAPCRPAIERLHEILERPYLDFQVEYQPGNPRVTPFPYLLPMDHSAIILSAEVILELRKGDNGAAATNIITLLALVAKDGTEGLLYSSRLNWIHFAVGPTWELLQGTNLMDTQLAIVQSGWQQMNWLADAEYSFKTERAWSLAEIQAGRESHAQFEAIYDVYWTSRSSLGSSNWVDALAERPRAGIAEAMWRLTWSYSEELNLLHQDQAILDTVRTMRTNPTEFYRADYDALSARLSASGLTNAGQGLFRVLKISDLSEAYKDRSYGTLSIALRTETARRVVVTAIALKRFQLKNGNWPQTLNGLVPEFIPAVPIDPYDGKPLKYHPNADGTFLLYSVGENGTDEGGDATGGSPYFGWQDRRSHDWVWPQPASPAEIQYFDDHQPK